MEPGRRTDRRPGRLPTVIGQPLWEVILPHGSAGTEIAVHARGDHPQVEASGGKQVCQQAGSIERNGNRNSARRTTHRPKQRVSIKTPQGMLGGAMLRDITESRQAQKAIANGEKRLRALIEHGRDNISLLSTDGKTASGKPSFCDPHPGV
ncbi:MAG: hypothetical protein MZV64_17545 [Ignavibacteriales bacterium]|nr:hypothetical protein [Ignavibacteriales bacterium]